MHEERSACRSFLIPGAERCSLDAEVNDGVVQELVLVQATQVMGIDLHSIQASILGVHTLQALQQSDEHN